MAYLFCCTRISVSQWTCQDFVLKAFVRVRLHRGLSPCRISGKDLSASNCYMQVELCASLALVTHGGLPGPSVRSPAPSSYLTPLLALLLVLYFCESIASEEPVSRVFTGQTVDLAT